MRWDWMVFKGNNLTLQIIFDLLMPLLMVWLFRLPRYSTAPSLEDPSNPRWQRDLWKYLLAALYLWFFAATIWHYFARSIPLGH